MQTLAYNQFNIPRIFRNEKALRIVTTVAFAALLLFVTALFSHVMAAGGNGGDTTFDSLTTMVVNWLQGSGGKFLAVLGFGIALAAGLIKGSVAGIVFGLGLALSAVYGPTILIGIFTAVL